MLSKMLVRISHGSAHGKVRNLGISLEISAKSSLAMAWNNGRKTAWAMSHPHSQRCLGHVVIEHERGTSESVDGCRVRDMLGHAVDDLGDTVLKVLHELNVKAAQRSFEHAVSGMTLAARPPANLPTAVRPPLPGLRER